MEAVNLGEPCPTCLGGLENTRLGTLHYGGPWPKNTFLSKNMPLVGSLDDFHTYTLDWDAGEMVWSIDGGAYATQTPATWDRVPHRGVTAASLCSRFRAVLVMIRELR